MPKPIITASKSRTNKRNLEDCKPGATRIQVLQFIDKAITSPKLKRAKSPAPTSK